MTAKLPTILVVDDEKRLCRTLEILLREEGPFNVEVASDYYSAVEKLKDPIDLVLSDLTMPGKSGLDFLRTVKAERPDLPVILMTAYSTVHSAVEAMKSGALDYIVKPFENEKLVALVRKILQDRFSQPREDVSDKKLGRFGDLLGHSMLMEAVYDQVQRASEIDSTVLVTGESGTGKELVARAIHYSGSRKSKPFIAFNCTAVPDSLLESELFGHERGAFSGAVRSREGRFELADGGTLFLDEIGEMNPALQVKLLRVLQEKEFVRVGGQKVVKVDVRIIAATNRELTQAVHTGEFREDLYYRLNVVVIHLPSLRERREDLPLLIDHFLTEKSRKNGFQKKSLNEGARNMLLQYSFPGNVRELENMIERAVVMSRETLIDVTDLPIQRKREEDSLDRMTLPIEKGMEMLDGVYEKLEKDVLERALKLHPDKSNSELADILGTSRRVLESRLKNYNLQKP